MNQHEHVTARNLAKKRIKLTRRQFLGLMGIVGAGTGALCGGLSAGSMLALSNQSEPIPTPTDSPTIAPTVSQDMTKPAMIDRETWGAPLPNINARNETGYYEKETNPEGWYVYPDTLENSYQTLVMHHTSYYMQDGISTLLDVQRLHRSDRGWADIAYHYLIDKDGTIYEGRELTVRGAHVGGYNTGSVGVCLMGNFMTETPSEAQLNATYALNQWLTARLQLTHLTGHSAFNDWTECPGTFFINQLEDMATRTGLTFGTDGYVPVSQNGCGCCACQTVAV